MIQRIQSVYLFIAALLMVVCACLPVGTISVGQEMGVPSTMYNIAIIDGANGTWDFTVCGLLGILVCSAASTVITIFNYNNRKAQSRSCLVNMILMLLWVGLYAALAYFKGGENFSYSYTALLPALAFVFIFLARRGVIHDEKLIKSMDRIR